MSNLQFVKPLGRVNYIRNPQFFWDLTAWQYTGGLSGSWQRDGYSWVGPASVKVGNDTGGSTTYAELTYTITLPRLQQALLSCWAMGRQQKTYDIAIYDSTNATVRNTQSWQAGTLGDWQLVSCAWTNETAGDVEINVRLRNPTGGTGYAAWYDAVMLQIQDPGTDYADKPGTYLDGEQEGCWWYAEPHNSYSERSAASRAGGVLLDAADAYHFHVNRIVDAGTPPVKNRLHSFATAPGGLVMGAKIAERPFLIRGQLRDKSGSADIHTMRRALIGELMQWSYPMQHRRPQPFRILYQGSDTEKYIDAHYEHPSLAGELGNEQVYLHYENIALAMLADDPWWYGRNQPGQDLSTGQSFNTSVFAVRSNDLGTQLWDSLSVTASNPQFISDIRLNPVDGKIYVTGSFTDWNGNAGWDYIVRYDRNSEAWEQVGGNSAINDTIFRLDIAPNGDVYIVGDFTDAGGSAGDYVAYYDLSGDAITPVKAGMNARVDDLVVLNNFDVWYVGGFTDVGDSDGDYMVMYDASADAWATFASRPGGTTSVVTTDVVTGNVYVVSLEDGIFNHVGYWTGSQWYSIGGDNQYDAEDMIFASDGMLYLTKLHESDAHGLSRWNGSAWVDVGEVSGDLASVHRVFEAPDGSIWITGAFTHVEDIYVGAGVARWDGTAWHRADLTKFEADYTLRVEALACLYQDPIISSNYELWLGISSTSSETLYGAQLNTLSNGGTAPAYPTFTFKREGGDAARIVSIRNERNGQMVTLNYELGDGEQLTVAFSARGVQVRSTFREAVTWAVVPGLDVASFYLIPGDNDVSILVHEEGSPTVTAAAHWRAAYSGVD